MITVFGSINIDLVTRVCRIAGPGETVIGDAYGCVPGGKGANQALAARRAGAAVRLIGAVGRDDFAETALATLQEAGVDLSGVVQSALPTGAAFISVDSQGRNAITVAAGANAAADGDAIRTLSFQAGDILLLQREVPDKAGETAARIAKAAGARVVLNLAPSGVVSESYLALIDILVVNEHEAADLTAGLLGRSAGFDELADVLQARFCNDTVVTLGSRGAIGWQDGAESRAEAFTIEIVDTTGAGDTFIGALAASLSEGASFADAVRFGTAAGSLACTRPGAQTGIPTRDEIDLALASRAHPEQRRAASACMALKRLVAPCADAGLAQLVEQPPCKR